MSGTLCPLRDWNASSLCIALGAGGVCPPTPGTREPERKKSWLGRAGLAIWRLISAVTGSCAQKGPTLFTTLQLPSWHSE